MSITAIVENDTIKLPMHVPDGTRARIVFETDGDRPLAERCAGLIGVTDQLPEDMAENHDHYLHGHPKEGMTVFADTYFYLALLFSARDAHHRRVVEYAQTFRGKVMTTQWILTEVADAMASVPERAETCGRSFVFLEEDPRDNDCGSFRAVVSTWHGALIIPARTRIGRSRTASLSRSCGKQGLHFLKR